MLCFQLKGIHYFEISGVNFWQNICQELLEFISHLKAGYGMSRTRNVGGENLLLKLSFYALTLVDSICWSPSQGYSSTPHVQQPPHLQWF